MKNLKKTEHFLYRQWDRGVTDTLLEKLLNNFKNKFKKKTLLIIGSNILKKYGEKVSNKKVLIIVLKKGVLITLFYVDDIYNYLKSISGKENECVIL